MGRINQITEVEFDQIKELLYRGETNGEIASMLGRGESTISYIRKARDLADYRRISQLSVKGLLKTGTLPDLNGVEVRGGDPYIRAGRQFEELLRTIVIILKQ